MTADGGTEPVGVLYMPVDRILAGSPARRGDALPGMSPADWRVVDELRSAMPRALLTEGSDVDAARARSSAMALARALSWMPYLVECVLNQARSYAQCCDGRTLMLEDIGFGESRLSERNPEDCVAYWCSLVVAHEVARGAGGDFRVGIRMNPGHGRWAMDIACRAGLSFVACRDASELAGVMLCRSRRMSAARRDWPEIYAPCLPGAEPEDGWDACGADGFVHSGRMTDRDAWKAAAREAEALRAKGLPSAADFGYDFDRRVLLEMDGAFEWVFANSLWHRNCDPLDVFDEERFASN